MPMNDILNNIANKNKGIIQTSNAVEAGISKASLYKFLEEHDFEKVAHGIYACKDAAVDYMYIISLRSKQAVFSHDTALYLHKMTDRVVMPNKYSVTVKTGYNPSSLKADELKVFTIKSDLHEVGLTSGLTPLGHTVAVYNVERTICDILRSRNNIDNNTFQEALRSYAKRTDRNIKLLMDYARAFRVDKLLIKYLEILL